MSHADGTVANHTAPVASLEAQALAYDALVEVGELHAADRLARSVEKHFWLGDFYAIGVDRDPATGAPRPLSTRASNMGWLLRSRLLDGREDRQRRIVELLFSDEFLAESGVRTLSNREVRFRSRSYHNGTVWPHDNYLISLGLEQRGFVDEAQELRRRLASFCRATHRFPEFVGGGEPGDPPFTKRIVDVYDTVNDRPNRIEQPPQEIVCWTVAAMVAVEHAPGYGRRQERPDYNAQLVVETCGRRVVVHGRRLPLEPRQLSLRSASSMSARSWVKPRRTTTRSAARSSRFFGNV